MHDASTSLPALKVQEKLKARDIAMELHCYFARELPVPLRSGQRHEATLPGDFADTLFFSQRLSRLRHMVFADAGAPPGHLSDDISARVTDFEFSLPNSSLFR